jgi:hypothetical protein
VPSHHRSVTFLICLAALAGTSTSALAKTHVVRSRKVTGVVVAINSRLHTLKLREGHGVSTRSARASSSSGGPVVIIAFGDADVTGARGAVAVGDVVTVTATSGGGGSIGVASSIQVIGQPNGGDAGKGAAIPGTVTSVNSASDTLVVATSSSSVTVAVTATTVLAISDPSSSGPVTLADISVGDRVVVFTDDATADPVAAVGVLDSGQPADPPGTGPQPTPPAGAPASVSFGGSVQSIDLADSTVTVTILKGARAGQVVTVDVTSSTSLKSGPGADDTAFSLADVKVGDDLSISAATLDADPIVAVGIYDGGQPTTPTPAGGSGSGSTAPSTTATPVKFAATVKLVGSDGLTVTPTNGPLTGQSVRVSVESTTSFELLTTPADVSQLQQDVAVGDTVEVYTLSEATTPIVAVGLVDYGTVPPSQ